MRGKHLAVLTVVLWAGSAAAQSVDPQALMDQLLRRQMREFQRQDAERQQQQREADKLWYWTGEPLEQRELDHRLAKDKYECLQEAPMAQFGGTVEKDYGVAILCLEARGWTKDRQRAEAPPDLSAYGTLVAPRGR
jgi:hypothetical protein